MSTYLHVNLKSLPRSIDDVPASYRDFARGVFVTPDGKDMFADPEFRKQLAEESYVDKDQIQKISDAVSSIIDGGEIGQEVGTDFIEKKRNEAELMRDMTWYRPSDYIVPINGRHGTPEDQAKFAASEQNDVSLRLYEKALRDKLRHDQVMKNMNDSFKDNPFGDIHNVGYAIQDFVADHITFAPVAIPTAFLSFPAAVTLLSLSALKDAQTYSVANRVASNHSQNIVDEEGNVIK